MPNQNVRCAGCLDIGGFVLDRGHLALLAIVEGLVVNCLHQCEDPEVLVNVHLVVARDEDGLWLRQGKVQGRQEREDHSRGFARLRRTVDDDAALALAYRARGTPELFTQEVQDHWDAVLLQLVGRLVAIHLQALHQALCVAALSAELLEVRAEAGLQGLRRPLLLDLNGAVADAEMDCPVAAGGSGARTLHVTPAARTHGAQRTHVAEV
mmetsp:Transcript_42225/g.134080  ORF Transcript_42225/g.134080 Transcript_42225/m.134080 type:complete len:210 (-) Transcript_42225:450-1079(-)